MQKRVHDGVSAQCREVMAKGKVFIAFHQTLLEPGHKCISSGSSMHAICMHTRGLQLHAPCRCTAQSGGNEGRSLGMLECGQDLPRA